MLSSRPSLSAIAALFVGAVAGSFLATQGLTSVVRAEPTRETTRTSSATALIDGSRHMGRVATQVTPAVVHIQATHDADGKRVEETGSGVLMRVPEYNGTFILTNSHVVRGASNHDIHIQTASGRSLRPAQVLEDRATDIAILTIPGNDHPIAFWGDSDEVEIGNIPFSIFASFRP